MAAPESVHRALTWVDRYGGLLEASELNRGAILSEASEAIEQPPAERPAVLSLAQCLAQPSRLMRQVAIDYPEEQAPKSVRARLSVLQQDLALSVIAPLTLRLFRDHKASLPDPERIFLVSIDASANSSSARPVSRWYLAPGAQAVDEYTFIRSLGKLTKDWYPTFRHEFGVSPGAYWSSIGLGLGAPFSEVWNRAEPEALCELAQRWLEAFDNSASQFIDWIPAMFGGKSAAIPQRKGCCLKYLLPEGDYCGTCGIYRKQRLTELRHRAPHPAQGQ